MLPVEQPFKTYPGKDGKPLDNGYVYFGQPNQNPVTSPVTVYWDAEGTIPAAQPIRTSNGYLMRAGSPANVFYSAAYSELVLDSKKRQVFFALDSTLFSFGSILTGTGGATGVGYGNTNVGALLKNSIGRVVNSISALRGIDVDRHTQAFVTGYYTPGDGGGGAYFFDASDSSSQDNGGTIIAATGGGFWKLVKGGLVSQYQFGAKGNGTADDTDALNRWGKYMLSGNAVANQHAGYGASGRFKVTGDGWRLSIGDFMPNLITDGADQFCITGSIPVLVTVEATGGSGQLPTAEWQGIKLDGGTAGTNIGVCVKGACFFICKGWHFYRLGVAIKLFNEKAGSFTEGVVFENAYFDTSVTTWQQFSKSAGDGSFRSSGLRQFKGNLGPAAGPAILIDSGCVPYMGPMDGIIWAYNPNSIFIRNNSSQVPFIGNLDTETQQAGTNKLILVDNSSSGYVFLCGSVLGWNYATGNLSKGKLITCREYLNLNDGPGQLFLPTNTAGSIVLGAGDGGTFSIPYTAGAHKPVQQDAALLTVAITAPNGYYWQGVYSVMSGQTDNIVGATMIQGGIVNNAGTYGPVTNNQGTDYTLKLTNTNLPAGARCSFNFNYIHGLVPQ